MYLSVIVFVHYCIDTLNQEWERRVLEEKSSVEQLQGCKLEVKFFSFNRLIS